MFQAIETRRDFSKGDVSYLANLCHDCRACYYACMYSPPHEFAVNVPQILSEARVESYKQWSWPGLLARSFADRRVAVSLGIGTMSVIIAAALSLIPGSRLFGVSRGPGAFYAVIPYLAIVIPAVALLVYWMLVWARGGMQFWSEANGNTEMRVTLNELAKATAAMLSLRYLKGGGPGCSYPDQKPSMARRVYHSLVFWGFLFDFAATTLAFIYQDLLHRLPPYPLTSAPVIFGSAGGLGLMAGTIGLMWLKAKSDKEPRGKDAYGMDYLFLGILFLAACTGMFTLVLRDTAALGSLLVLHLALVASLFITAPYGKFVHALYRPLALIKFHAETQRH